MYQHPYVSKVFMDGWSRCLLHIINCKCSSCSKKADHRGPKPFDDNSCVVEYIHVSTNSNIIIRSHAHKTYWCFFNKQTKPSHQQYVSSE